MGRDLRGASEAAPGEVAEAGRPEGDARERLLEAAERLYTAKGSRGMTTRAVAAEACVSELTLFRQFGSKRGLLRAMTERLAAVPMIERMLSEANTGDLVEDLCHIARAIQANARAMLPFIQRALAEAGEHPEHLEMASARPRAALTRLAAFFEQRMEAGQVRAGDPLMMAHAFSAMIFARLIVAPLYADMITHSEQKVVEEFVNLFAHGVAAPSAPPSEA